MDTNMTDNSNKIAIIGMSCRLPGANTIDQFWSNLVNGVESLTSFTDDELRAAGVDESLIHSPNYVRSRGIINGAEYFDAAFFDVTPRDAEIMDPQHRIFMECAWHALEDAGYDPEKSKARIGVFGGTGVSWHLNSTTNNPEVVKYASGTSIVTSNDKDYVATRVSYKFNLKGPSLTVQSACSTSMSAIVLGVSSLLNYQSDMVLAGGATIELPERRGYLYQEGGLESSDGHCRTFDKSADGTVFSRGAGVVLLKRYEEAVKDGDHIYAVILGGAINNDGNRKVGYTAPSVEGQVNVAMEAIELSGIGADTIGYVEAHGTATAVGDPIEVTSLSQVFGAYSSKKQYCALGSVKTNIGHTDSASGVTGLIKAALVLKNKQIPAHLHYKEPNPKIDFANSPFYVNTALQNWNDADTPRRALVNSFGVGGTNACVILEEAPQPQQASVTEDHKLLLLSAKSDTALEATKSNLHDFLQQDADINLDDMAYTYQTGRRYFDHRQVVTFTNREELLEKLKSDNAGQKGNTRAANLPLIFMFPGQGNQYYRMGAELYEENAHFRQVVDECCDFLLKKFDLDLRSLLFYNNDGNEAKKMLEKTYVTQPAIFVISYAMAQVLMNNGLKPSAMIGHSVGEYVAACISGIMSVQDALTAVATRGALIQKLPGGAMLAVLQNEDKVLPHLFDGVEIAAVNNPGMCVVAGSHENIDLLEGKLTKHGLFFKRLSTSHAFHSAMMEPCLPEFATMFEKITLSEPTIPIISTLTGNFLTEQEATDPQYWVNHVRRMVRFSDAVITCLDMNSSVFVEAGPGQSLESAVKRHLNKDSKHSAVRTMTTETETMNDSEMLTAAIGNVWLAGGEIDWEVYHKGHDRAKVSLPCYPYERKAYSIDFLKVNTVTTKANKRYSDMKDWYSVPVWKRSANIKYMVNAVAEKQSWLALHNGTRLAKEIIASLKEMNQQVYEVSCGAEFQKIAHNSYIINAESKESYELLVKDLVSNGVDIQNIIHLLNYTEEQRELTLNTLASSENISFFSPLYLQQALYEANKLKELQFSLVANGVYDVVGEQVYAPEKALAIGPCRVLIQEFPAVRARFIDVDVHTEKKQLRTLANNIILETQQKTYETLVSYRNGYRWTEGYSRFPFKGSNEVLYKNGGIYLITGGVGGIGIVTAKAIAEEVKATFVLTYQSAMPARAEWNAWLENNPGISFIREKIEGIKELEAMGATVIEKQVNVADYESMKRMVSEIELTVGSIDGVIHSAGSVGGGVIPLKTRDSVRPVFDSKFAGTVILDKIFADHSLDFFLLYSSITSILGEGTRLDYCSANAFLDAFAAKIKYTRNHKVVSINWSGWKGTGMAVRWEKEKAEKTHKAKTETHRPKVSDTILRRSKDMLQLLKKEDGTHTFEVSFKPQNDWIINSHFIINQPTVVGTSFIELAVQAGNMLYPGKKLELRNLYFASPMMFENGTGKKVRLVIEEKNDKLKFRFRTQPLNKNEDRDIWHDHFSGELLLSEKEPAPVDITILKGKLSTQVDTSKSPRIVYNKQNLPLIDLGERWDIDNTIYVGENEWLACLNLRKEFAGDTDYFDYHPAIMDKATSYALRYTSGQTTYLPFSYKSVRPYGKLPAKVYAYATPVNITTKNQETVAFDIRLIDDKGTVLMEIQEYTMKQVNETPAVQREPERDKTADLLMDTFDYLDPEQGAAVIKHILSNDFPEQLIIYPCDFDFMLEDNLPDTQKRAEEKEKLKNAGKSYYSRPALGTPYAEPANEMEKTIARIWQDILGLDKVGRDDTFTELGGNSLLAIQTIANIVDVLEVELSAQAFYDNPTVKGLAEAVVASIIDQNEIENLEELIENMGLETEGAV
jgi:phthiocerol/phenolphthiocerol synthesis type-I polyketide synthase E